MRAFLFNIILLCGLSSIAHADSMQFGRVHYIDQEDLDNPHSTIYLTDTWQFNEGDNMLWSDPYFDDFLWDDVSTLLGPNQLPLINWRGIGWFRLTLDVDKSLVGKPLALDVALQSGAAEIYLNGELLYSFGVVSANPEEEVAYQERKPRSLVFTEPGINIIAVRYSNHNAQRFLDAGYPAGFRYLLVEMNHQVSGVLNATRQITIQQYLYSGILFVFTIIHLLLFIFYPKQRQNLYFALFAAFFGVLNYVNHEVHFSTSGAMIMSLMELQLLFVIATMVAFLLFSYSLYYSRIPIQFWLFLAVFVTIGAVQNTVQGNVYEWVFGIAVVLFLVEVLRILIVAIWKKRKGAWVFSTGLILFMVSQLYSAGVNLEYIQQATSASIDYINVGGIVALLITMSVSLSRSFAETNLRLESKLREVQELSQKAIEQEREKKARELERLLLEADNQRKTRELEDARQLQLSMLPNDLPGIGGVEVAVRIKTASEVGGDYYDFAIAEDRSLTVALGDATGHGVKAGIVVATAKSYFNSFATQLGLIDLLKVMSRGIRNMNLRMIYMAITLLRFKDDKIELVGAGMPPCLLYRNSTGKVHTLLSKGMPLGSTVDFPYKSISTKVEENDLLIMMSDGIMEAFNKNRDQLGIEAIEKTLRQHGELSPGQVLDKLESLTSEWIKGVELEDDYTILALKFHPQAYN